MKAMRFTVWFCVLFAIFFNCGKSNNPSNTSSLLAPMLYSPLNGTINQDDRDSVALTWTQVNDAAMYDLQVSTISSFTSIAMEDSMARGDTAYFESSANTTYYWRLRSLNSAGKSTWSGTWNFTTIIEPPTPQIPADRAINQSIVPTFIWDTITGNIVNFQLQVSADSLFTNPSVNDTNLNGRSKSVGPLAYSMNYYWRVRANTAKETSAWSVLRRFSTIAPIPGVPVLFVPSNGATNISLHPTLQWSSVSSAVTYRLQVSSNSPVFTENFIDDSTLVMPQMAISGLFSNMTYHWRVAAENGGGSSSWSSAWNFTTGVPALQVINPVAGQTYKVGDIMQVKWQVNDTLDVSSVIVQLYHDTLITTLGRGSFPPDTTSFSWLVNSAAVSNHCYVKIQEYFNTVPPDSSGIFSIIDSSNSITPAARAYADQHYRIDSMKAYLDSNGTLHAYLKSLGIDSIFYPSIFPDSSNLKFLQQAGSKSSTFYSLINQGPSSPFIRGWDDLTPAVFTSTGFQLSTSDSIQYGIKSSSDASTADSSYLLYLKSDSTTLLYGQSAHQQVYSGMIK